MMAPISARSADRADRQIWALEFSRAFVGRRGLRHVETGDGVDRRESLAAEWLKVDLFAVQAACDALDHAPLPNRCCIETGTSREPPGPYARVCLEELDRIASHQDSEIEFRFSQHAVWIYQLEVLVCL